MTRVIERERLPRTDRRLGRNVNHDSESRRYAFRAPERTVLHAVRHQRHVPIFDQGNLGSCTGNAAVGCMATGGFYTTVDAGDADWLEPLDEGAAVACYSKATAIDPWPGVWPPEDSGSDGLSVAKVLTAAGAISGYEHAFTLDDVLAALMDRPWITGTVWLNGMFDPDAEGIIHPTGGVAGGHEYVGVEYDPVRGLVGFDQSWGYWGLNGTGRFYMEAEKYGDLLARDGDVTVFVPVIAPAPTPAPALEPATPADRALRAAVGDKRIDRKSICANTERQALRVWRAAKDWT